MTSSSESVDQLLNTIRELSLKNEDLERKLGEERYERMRLESRCAEILEHQAGLIREIHHRVKNNLQIVTSLLNLQETGTGADGSPLRKARNRIRAIALVHEAAYERFSSDEVPIREYLEQLSELVLASFPDRHPYVTLEFELSDAEIPMDDAIQLGLILNELLSNTLLHAYPQRTACTVEVRFTPIDETRARLEVRDTGYGLPERFEPEHSPGLGFQLVTALTAQIKGVFSCTRESPHGTTAAVEFPLTRK